MTYTINDDCINCCICVDECPAEAIGEGAAHYVIDEDKCTECGTCVAVCPVGAAVES